MAQIHAQRTRLLAETKTGISSQIIIEEEKLVRKLSDHGLKVAHKREQSDFFGALHVPNGDLRKFLPKRRTIGHGLGPSIWNDTTVLRKLTKVETNMLTRYSEAYRFCRYGRTMDFGADLDRLVRPLNDTLDYTGIGTNQRK